jgi:23S rRNA pseudouridine2605 synthase
MSAARQSKSKSNSKAKTGSRSQSKSKSKSQSKSKPKSKAKSKAKPTGRGRGRPDTKSRFEPKSQPRKRSQPASKGSVPPELADKSRGERIQKVMADLGVASRRECENLITQGHITVNGQPLTGLPAWVDPQTDRIEIDGQVVISPKRARAGSRGGSKASAGAMSGGGLYIALHKPRNVITTTNDPQGRRTVMDLIKLPPGRAKRMYPVGRLDADSSGLILMTNDGELANQLTHPRYEVEKQYEVSIKGRLTDGDIKRLKEGLYLATRGAKRKSARKSQGKWSTSETSDDLAQSKERAGKAASAKKAKMSQIKRLGYQRDKERGDRTNVLITLREGQNREIRRMIAKLGFKVRRLKRIAIGPIKLKGLAISRWRALTTAEVTRLRRAGTPQDQPPADGRTAR